LHRFFEIQRKVVKAVIHFSILAQYPGLLRPMLEQLGYINIIVDDGDERLQCNDPTGTVLLELNHANTLPGASSMHLGIVSDNTQTRRRATEIIKSYTFIPTKRYGLPQTKTAILGYVEVGTGHRRGRIAVEVCTATAHT
jgi:hypothetical protein